MSISASGCSGIPRAGWRVSLCHSFASLPGFPCGDWNIMSPNSWVWARTVQRRVAGEPITGERHLRSRQVANLNILECGRGIGALAQPVLKADETDPSFPLGRDNAFHDGEAIDEYEQLFALAANIIGVEL